MLLSEYFKLHFNASDFELFSSMNLTALLNTEIKGPDPFSEVKDLDAATVRNEAACIRADLSVFFYYIDYYLKV